MAEAPDLSKAEITEILSNLNYPASGYEELIPIVHRELRRISGQIMWRERPGQDLQPTELVNEAYLRLTTMGNIKWQNRAHFFAVSARIMRRILIDRARALHAKKRGGLASCASLDEVVSGSLADPGRFIALNEALERLEKIDHRQATVVELRFFGGLTEAEIAQSLGISIGTVKGDWRMARAWLLCQLTLQS